MNPKSLGTVKKILEDFTAYTGLEENNNKSSATFSKVCEGRTELHNILGFSIKQLLISYLGLSISGKEKIIQPMLEFDSTHKKPTS